MTAALETLLGRFSGARVEGNPFAAPANPDAPPDDYPPHYVGPDGELAHADTEHGRLWAPMPYPDTSAGVPCTSPWCMTGGYVRSTPTGYARESGCGFTPEEHFAYHGPVYLYSCGTRGAAAANAVDARVPSAAEWFANATADLGTLVQFVGPAAVEYADEGPAAPAITPAEVIAPGPAEVVPPPALEVPHFADLPLLLGGGVALTGKPAQLHQLLTAAVRGYSRLGRSEQDAIGPSEIGDPCDAFVLRRTLGFERVVHPDPWASFVGTAVHSRLADVFEWANALHRQELPDLPVPWRVERRVYMTDGIGGTADLERGLIVIDHKVIGVDTMKKIKAKAGMSGLPKYRTQLHLYGYGYRRAGVPIEHVALVGWPRSGFLDGVIPLVEPYDEAIAVAAMDRLSGLVQQGVELKADEDDAPWDDGRIATTPGKSCGFCPWYLPNNPITRMSCNRGRDFQSDSRAGAGPRGVTP